MKKAANIFSKCMFWLENITFIVGMLFYELLLVPIAYIKIAFNIATFGSLQPIAKFLPFWIIGGPFLLLAALGHDMFYFFRILMNYQENS